MFDYRFLPSDTGSVWPIYLGLDSFISTASGAQTALKLTVGNFMDEARAYYQDAQADIGTEQQLFRAAVLELQSHLNTFKSMVEEGVTR